MTEQPLQTLHVYVYLVRLIQLLSGGVDDELVNGGKRRYTAKRSHGAEQSYEDPVPFQPSYVSLYI